MAWNVAVRVEAGDLLLKAMDTIGWIFQSLAWPVAAVVMILLMRGEIRGLLRRLKHGSWAGAEFHFDERLGEIASQREEAVDAGAPDAANEGSSSPDAQNAETPADSSASESGPHRSDQAQHPIPGSSSGRPISAHTVKKIRRGAGKALFPPKPAVTRKPVFSRLKDIEKPLGKWETAYHNVGSAGTLALTSPRAAILRSWGMLEKELNIFAPNHLAAALGLFSPELVQALTAEELSRLWNLKALAADLENTEGEPSIESALSYIELANDLRDTLRRRRSADPDDADN